MCHDYRESLKNAKFRKKTEPLGLSRSEYFMSHNNTEMDFQDRKKKNKNFIVENLSNKVGKQQRVTGQMEAR